jgi:phospholipid-translocating ATPase
MAGNETKSGMSRGTAEPKLTAADAMIDKLTVAIFMFQIIIVLVLGFVGNIWKDNQGHKVIFLYDNYCRGTKIHCNFHAYFLVL